MYIPTSFAWDDAPSQFAFVRDHPFATLVAAADGSLAAQHLPILIAGDPADVASWRIATHVALGNPLLAADHALAVVQGPHAYVSASWYEAADTVPTWNFLAVHLHLRLEPVTDAAQVHALFERAAATWDPEAAAWQERLDPATRDRLATGIRWLSGRVERIEAKAKLSQNHPPERRRRVIARLDDQDEAARATGAAMLRCLDGRTPWPCRQRTSGN